MSKKAEKSSRSVDKVQKGSQKEESLRGLISQVKRSSKNLSAQSPLERGAIPMVPTPVRGTRPCTLIVTDYGSVPLVRPKSLDISPSVSPVALNLNPLGGLDLDSLEILRDSGGLVVPDTYRDMLPYHDLYFDTLRDSESS